MAVSWKAQVGINHVPAFQVSGRPYASASVGYSTTSAAVDFPYVTRWFQVINKTGIPMRVGFSSLGVKRAQDNCYFTVDASGSGGYGKSGIYEMKVSSIWLYGASAGICDVVAGLTTIPVQRTTTDTGLNWSGSAGVL